MSEPKTRFGKAMVSAGCSRAAKGHVGFRRVSRQISAGAAVSQPGEVSA